MSFLLAPHIFECWNPLHTTDTIQLNMADKKDYYEQLGVTRTATADELKKAYRKLALEWHPDRHQKDKEIAEKKFKELNEAYQVLSDPKKRAVYDQHGHAAFAPGGGGGSAASGNPFGGFQYSYQQGGQNPFGSADFGDPFEIFEQFFGGGFNRAPQKPHYALAIEFMEAVKGVEKQVSIEGKKRTIKIPAGVENGNRINFDDFSLTISVKPSSDFERDGADIYGKVLIPYSFAVMGGNIDVKTVEGNVKLKVRAGTQSGTMMRLRGKGVKNIRSFGHGDHYVQIKVEIPEKLSREQRSIINELKKAGL